jgi:hypothetical protein
MLESLLIEAWKNSASLD